MLIDFLGHPLDSLIPAAVIEKPEIEAYCERALMAVEKADAATSPIPFLEEEIDDDAQKTGEDEHQEVLMKSCSMQTNECKSTQTITKSVSDSSTCTDKPEKSSSKSACSNVSVCKCSCSAVSAKSYSSNFKFYTSLALAGLFAIFFAVSTFSPEIHKSYSRPPPL